MIVKEVKQIRNKVFDNGKIKIFEVVTQKVTN